jgi:DMSO/TMAO reductase YedYZ heme-binding membrane subunit
MARVHRPSTPAIVVAAAAAAFAAAAYAYATQGGWSFEGAMAGARLTARVAFLWFVAAWSASSLARLWPGGWRAQLLFRRRAVGLGFAAAHSVHLVALLVATLVFAAERDVLTILGGGAGYVFMAAMALTSNDSAVRALGPRNWKLLHASGGYVLAGIFAFSYYKALGEKPLVAIPALTLIGGATALRLLAWAKMHVAAETSRARRS